MFIIIHKFISSPSRSGAITNSLPLVHHSEWYKYGEYQGCHWDGGEGKAPPFGGALAGLFEPIDGGYTKEKRLLVLDMITW